MEHNTGYVLRPSAQAAMDRSDGQPLFIAEVGVREGQNTIAMLKFMNVAHVFMIDGYEPYYSNVHDHSDADEQEIWYRNMFHYMTPYLPRVTFITKSSKFASQLFDDGSLDYVYIDANHSKESVLEDMGLWYPKVKKGGVLGGHDMDDVRFPDISIAVAEFCTKQQITFTQLKNDWMIIK